ncbi:MAG TPA: antitoxin Xre/MbcA/ParS toxin-binding domain-containing protein [Chthoniobacterales bacterium]
MKTAAAKKPARKAAGKNGANGAAPHELVNKVQAGLRFSELEDLRRSLGLPLDQLGAKLGISRATLHRRKTSGRLAPDQSDKVLRFARLFQQAKHVFGDDESARVWLNFPQWSLGDAVPLDYARSEVGAREVENLLGAIEYGVYT